MNDTQQQAAEVAKRIAALPIDESTRRYETRVTAILAPMLAEKDKRIAEAEGDLAQLRADKEAADGLLREAANDLADCAQQFKGHNMIASYDVAKVYENEIRAHLK